MAIDLKTARSNAIEFFNSPGDIFVGNQDGKLIRISKFNLLGRFVEWIKDWNSNWKRSENTDKIFKESLEVILSNLKSDPKNNYSFVSCCTPKLPCFKKYAVDYSHKTMVNLADRVMSSLFGTKPEIRQIAVQIQITTSEILKNLSEEEKNKLAEHPFL